MRKIVIPLRHYQFYQKVYAYLDKTLGVEPDTICLTTMYRKILTNYQSKSQISKPDHIEGSREKFLRSDFSLPSSSTSPISTSSNFYQTNYSKENNELAEEVKICQACGLWKCKTRDVSFGGKNSSVMILTDIPSYFDQLSGRHFSDKSGELMSKILRSIGLKLEEIYVTSAVKCASPKELPHALEEILQCTRFLEREVNLLKPTFILAFGENTYKMLHNGQISNSWRGTLEKYLNIPILFTHHPRDLLFDVTLKKETWNDLKKSQSFFQNQKKN